MVIDPKFAPRRDDLPWLRRRRLPAAAVPEAPPAAAPLHDFFTGHSTAHAGAGHASTSQGGASNGATGGPHEAAETPHPVSFARPGSPPPSGSLDLDGPPPPPSGSLDLDRPPAPPSGSLDLDEPSAPASSLDLDESAPAHIGARRLPSVTSAAPSRRVRTDVRVEPGERLILTPVEPTVTLTRLQSGIGALSIEAAVSERVGDLRLGCAYELTSELQMTMQMTQGSRLAPPHSKRPIIIGSRDRFEKVSFDLRQCRTVRRALVYAFSEGRAPLAWGGTLVVTTFGGGRIEVAMEALAGGTVAALLSIYQVRGELVLRAEMQGLNGDVREATRAYGYDKITWLDDRTPVE